MHDQAKMLQNMMLSEAAVVLQMSFSEDWSWFGHIQAKILQNDQKSIFGKKLHKSFSLLYFLFQHDFL